MNDETYNHFGSGDLAGEKHEHVDSRTYFETTAAHLENLYITTIVSQGANDPPTCPADQGGCGSSTLVKLEQIWLEHSRNDVSLNSLGRLAKPPPKTQLSRSEPEEPEQIEPPRDAVRG